MNVSLHKKLFFPLLLALLWQGAACLFSQSTGVDLHLVTMLKNTSDSTTFLNYGVVPPTISKHPKHGTAGYYPNTGNPNYGIKGSTSNPATNNLVYTPTPGFTGRDTVEIKYTILAPGPMPANKLIYFTVVPSFLYAENDYAATVAGQPIEISVLTNDFGNGTNLTVAEVPNVNYGTAVRTQGNTKIRFTPVAGFTGVAHLNYTICDAQGSCDMATVSICVNPVAPPQYDSIFITTRKNTPQVLLLEMDNNYTLFTPPLHGDIDDTDVLTYLPDLNYTGTDKVVYKDLTNNRTRVCMINVINGPSKNTYLFDDVVYTGKNETIEKIFLLKNDNGGQYLTNVAVNNYPVTQQGGQLVYLNGQGKGVYQYTPPTGFTGIDKFTYHAQTPIGNITETATCYIVVSNQNPVEAVYQITTPKNTPLVLGDHLPIPNYEYVNLTAPDEGSLVFYPGVDTVTSTHGQVFRGNNMLVYTPNADYVGEDEFEFNYCPGVQTNGCPLVKVEVTVVEVTNPQADTLCAGRECVWPGDANLDGTVDVRDILPVGWCMGDVGASRTNGSVAWYGQHANNWRSLYANLGYDVKYVDTDGNGIVTSSDTAAIGQFYGKYHNLTAQPTPPISDLPFYIEEPDFTTIGPGDVLYAPIHLGNDSLPAIDAYGLTFQLDYDPSIFESVNVHFDETSWMRYNSPVLSLKHSPFGGRIDAGYTRTSGVSATGHGIIGVVEFIVVDDLSLRLNKYSTHINVRSLGFMNGIGQTFGLEGNTLTFHLNTNEENDDPKTLQEQLKVFPNPATQFVNVHLNGKDNEIERVALYNVTGGQVYDSGSMQAKRASVDVSQFTPGIYMLRVWANDEVLNEKVEVVR
jgi:hypothetical protein